MGLDYTPTIAELGLDWNPTSPPTVATPLRIDSLKILPGELETIAAICRIWTPAS